MRKKALFNKVLKHVRPDMVSSSVFVIVFFICVLYSNKVSSTRGPTCLVVLQYNSFRRQLALKCF